jgi:hypothetical protein
MGLVEAKTFGERLQRGLVAVAVEEEIKKESG